MDANAAEEEDHAARLERDSGNGVGWVSRLPCQVCVEGPGGRFVPLADWLGRQAGDFVEAWVRVVEYRPLPCRLFPFVLVPQGDHWGVSVRYACPSAAANKGRPLSKHEELPEFAALLAKREGLTPQPDGTLIRPPPLQSGQRIAWPELQCFVKPLLNLLRDRSDPLERRMRKCLAFATVCRQAKDIAQLEGDKLRELLAEQQEINRRLDLDKSETQVVEEREEETITGREHLNGRRRARREAQLSGSAVI